MPEPILTEPIAVFLTIMAVILITPLISEWARLPGIVGLILGGMLVGPHGLNLLTTGRTVELLSTVGLIYLMFTAGLGIDLHQFNRVRNKALMFGLWTFILPVLSGIAMGRILGLGWMASILLGSIYASHTLVAFPILTRLGIVKNEAVAVTIGATVISSVAALLILAIVAGAQGETGVRVTNLVSLIILMVGYTFIILIGLPKLGKFFFSHFTSRAVEFQFVLVALFVAALLADMIGMHAIVGAFLAGLAVNSSLPSRSRVVGQVIFLGDSFFIPIFLMFIGMVLDPLAIVGNLEVLVIGVLLTVAVYVTKFGAAWITARMYNYTHSELMVMWGLSQAQAAATLATLLVGLEIGLFNQAIFNGAILMVMLTVISSSVIVQRYGVLVQPETPGRLADNLFARILVPIANPDTQEHLITLAAILARAANGTLYPLHVALEVQGRVGNLDLQRRLLQADILNDPETDIQPIPRVDTSIAKGILRVAFEKDITLIVIGWRGKPTFRQTIFGTVLDEVIWNAPIPVLVGRLVTPINALQRVLLILPPNSISMESIERTVEISTAIADAINVPLVVMAAGQYLSDAKTYLKKLDHELSVHFDPLGEDLVGEVTTAANHHDLMIVTTTGSRSRFRSSLGSVPEELAAATGF